MCFEILVNHSNVNSCNRSLSPSLGDKLLVVSITVKIEDGEYFRRGAQGDDLLYTGGFGRALDLSGKGLSKVPEAVTDLTELEDLDWSDNYLEELRLERVFSCTRARNLHTP